MLQQFNIPFERTIKDDMISWFKENFDDLYYVEIQEFNKVIKVEIRQSPISLREINKLIKRFNLKIIEFGSRVDNYAFYDSVLIIEMWKL